MSNFDSQNGVLDRKGEETGYFPSMFLHMAGKKEKYEAARTTAQGQKPPPRRYVRDYIVKTQDSRTLQQKINVGSLKGGKYCLQFGFITNSTSL